MIRIFAMLVMTVFLTLVLSSITLASSTGMPWEGPISRITESITGPVAKAIGIIMIVITAFGFASADEGGMLKKAMGVCLALTVAFSASTFFLPMFGFAGGVFF